MSKKIKNILKVAGIVGLFFLVSGCGNNNLISKPINQALQSIEMAKKGNEIGSESLKLGMEINEKMNLQKDITDVTDAIMKKSDAEIKDRDIASKGAEEAVVRVRVACNLTVSSFSLAKKMRQMGKVQQKLAKNQLQETKELLNIIKETDTLSKKSEALLNKSLQIAQEGAGQLVK